MAQGVCILEGNTRPRVMASDVVSMGASAGGLEALEALEALFSDLPLDIGMAFVVGQQLSSDFQRHMEELLARKTRIPVHVVGNQEAVGLVISQYAATAEVEGYQSDELLAKCVHDVESDVQHESISGQIDAYGSQAKTFATEWRRADGTLLPVKVSVSGPEIEGEREACIEMGCDDYFPRPIDGPKLMNLVAFHLGK